MRNEKRSLIQKIWDSPWPIFGLTVAAGIGVYSITTREPTTPLFNPLESVNYYISQDNITLIDKMTGTTSRTITIFPQKNETSYLYEKKNSGTGYVENWLWMLDRENDGTIDIIDQETITLHRNDFDQLTPKEQKCFFGADDYFQAYLKQLKPIIKKSQKEWAKLYKH